MQAASPAPACRLRMLVLTILLAWLPLSLAGVLAAQAAEERSDWEEVFGRFEASGTVLVVDRRDGALREWVHDPARAAQRFSPASTFKIPHTLFALDAGLVADEFQVFAWDGVARSFAGHNRDQDLRSAMRSSAIWVYQGFAAAIGEAGAQAYLGRAAYGNRDAATEGGDYWVYGRLAISAREQVEFLERLYRNALPFAVEHQRLVKDLIIVEAGYHWILRAKTGWDGQIGWWVGWVEWPEGPVFFALNIDTPNRLADLDKRQQIGRAVLRTIGALPGD